MFLMTHWRSSLVQNVIQPTHRHNNAKTISCLTLFCQSRVKRKQKKNIQLGRYENLVRFLVKKMWEKRSKKKIHANRYEMLLFEKWIYQCERAHWLAFFISSMFQLSTDFCVGKTCGKLSFASKLVQTWWEQGLYHSNTLISECFHSFG